LGEFGGDVWRDLRKKNPSPHASGEREREGCIETWTDRGLAATATATAMSVIYI
jgi:hypothetical protein